MHAIRPKLPITVAIPVKNEEINLPGCLARLGRFEQVVVIDSSSTDRTRQIAEDAGATYFNFAWDGHYPKKRNWFLLNHAPATPWVLFLDADEFLTEAFIAELESAIAVDGIDGYWLGYTNFFQHRALRHGVPQRKLALFRVGKALYERIEEADWSTLDMEIHEHAIVAGPVGRIKARIDHHDDRGVIKLIDRHRNYALWEARRTLALYNGPPAAWDKLTDRQRTKYRNLGKWWYAWAYFIWDYIVQMGFLDGHQGFSYAFYKVWYFKTIRLLIRERLIAPPRQP